MLRMSEKMGEIQKNSLTLNQMSSSQISPKANALKPDKSHGTHAIYHLAYGPRFKPPHIWVD